jgi:branched-chain amino acid transport system ATP-binding protein
VTLVVEGVSLAYGQIQAVRGASLEVGEAQIVALLGRNGAGKTTTLSGIAGLLRPQAGTIRFGGRVISTSSPSDIARYGIGYVPEGRGIFGGLTVRENLAVPAYARGLKHRTAHAEIIRAIGYFPALEDRLEQRAGTLSGGQQQMLAVARALVVRPRLLLLDEPGLGLAPIIVGELYQQFVRLRDEDGMSILLVEQYVDLALRTASYAYVMEKGEVSLGSRSGTESLASDRELIASRIT